MDQWQWLTDLKIFFDPPHTKIRLGARDLLGLWPVWLSLKRFSSHMYVVGQSGKGKSKFLQHILFEMSTKGWGCGVFDPHSDLASDLLVQLASYPPQQPWLAYPFNRNRIVYFDAARTDYLMPFNILKQPHLTPYEIANNVIDAFRRVWPQTLEEAPRFAQIMRNAILTLIANGLTLLELEALLTDSTFRQRLLSNVSDFMVVSFFRNQFDRWGREQALYVGPVLNKVTAFLFKPNVRSMFGANDNVLNVRTIMDEGKLLIVDLGRVNDKDTRSLIGSLLLSSFENGAKSRVSLPPQRRRPFFLVVDEFPSFCAADPTVFAEILSECRKFKFHLGLCHQTMTQLPNERLKGAIENAALKIVFGTGRGTAEAIVKELFMPDTQAVKHRVKDTDAQERTHPIYEPLLEQFERSIQTIQRLRRRKALISLPDKPKVYQVRVPYVPAGRINPEQVERMKLLLTKAVGRSVTTISQEIIRRAKRHGVPLYTQESCSPSVRKNEEFWQ